MSKNSLFFAVPTFNSGQPMNETDRLRHQVSELRQGLEQRDALLQRISETAMGIGTVIAKNGSRCVVALGNTAIEANVPRGGCEVGDVLRIIKETGQPVDVLPMEFAIGQIFQVRAVHGDLLELDAGGGMTRTALAGRLTVTPGERVVLDGGGAVAVKALGREAANEFTFEEATNVSWDDIGGLHDAKEAIREAIEYPLTHAHLYSGYGAKPSRGVLIYGPPGCGKTMLGKATATALQRAHGKSGTGGFLYVKGPEILSKWVGATEANVRKLFTQAREFRARTGRAAVLFIDEADALLRSRDTAGGITTMQGTVVPAFLAEMDGLMDSGAFVMLSTNRPDTLDSAVTRDGRIDQKVQVTRPDRDNTLEIFKLHFRGKPVAGDNVEAMGTFACEQLFDDTRHVLKIAVNGHDVVLNLGDIVSGALVAGVVARATRAAMRRDRENDCQEPSGITTGDVREAITQARREMAHLDWREELIAKARSVVPPQQQ